MRFAVVVILFIASSSMAQMIDGKKVLEEESKKINEMSELKHQVDLMKQKVQLLKQMELMKKHGGLDNSTNNSDLALNTTNSYTQQKSNDLPRLIKILNKKALLISNKESLLVSQGDYYKDEYLVKAISVYDGVVLYKDNKDYILKIK